jgi:hypothetical protein
VYYSWLQARTEFRGAQARRRERAARRAREREARAQAAADSVRAMQVSRDGPRPRPPRAGERENARIGGGGVAGS